MGTKAPVHTTTFQAYKNSNICWPENEFITNSSTKEDDKQKNVFHDFESFFDLHKFMHTMSIKRSHTKSSPFNAYSQAWNISCYNTHMTCIVNKQKCQGGELTPI